MISDRVSGQLSIICWRKGTLEVLLQCVGGMRGRTWVGCFIPLCKLQDSDTIELFYGLHRGAWGVADLGLI